MRIAVSGTHGIGKTTLVQALAEKYKFDIVPEQARNLLETEFPYEEINTDLSRFEDFEREILLRQTALEQELKDEFISDRPLIDHLVYVKERFSRERCDDREYYTWYTAWVDSSMVNRYDLILHLRPAETILEKDRNRSSSPYYASVIDALLFYEFTERANLWNSLIVEITSDGLQKRIEEASKYIDSYTYWGRR